ncbi:5-carboxymethyl-2-hydroxymuconate Delta-isomerase [Azospirillum sp. ST 5-10]|uniref:5-carboxymethyl-2-hydroxymuconate Delta-isomerase n=1 Tax=unclassified Azospirillum TaxID=2630922 RepID=UPI003F4A2406
MPHFVIEYARPVEAMADPAAVMETVFHAAAGSGIMNPDDIKIRAIPFDHYRLPRPGETFLHVGAFLLEGRSDAQKEDLAVRLRAALAGILPDVTSISVDVRDMNPVAYKKRLLPSGD